MKYIAQTILPYSIFPFPISIIIKNIDKVSTSRCGESLYNQRKNKWHRIISFLWPIKKHNGEINNAHKLKKWNLTIVINSKRHVRGLWIGHRRQTLWWKYSIIEYEMISGTILYVTVVCVCLLCVCVCVCVFVPLRNILLSWRQMGEWIDGGK